MIAISLAAVVVVAGPAVGRAADVPRDGRLINQTASVIALNIRSIPQRLWMSFATVMSVPSPTRGSSTSSCAFESPVE